ncbi:hypothetical protein WJ977_04695 [Achromobacter xylosoxidans]
MRAGFFAAQQRGRGAGRIEPLRIRVQQVGRRRGQQARDEALAQRPPQA